MIKNFTSLQDFQKAFGTELKCVKHIEQLRWQGKPVCNRCGNCGLGIYKLAKVGTYKCKCVNFFSVRKGTIFEDSALPLTKWFLAMFLEVSRPKGISSHQLAKDLGITQKTAWFLLQRIRWALAHNTIEKMTGDVEVDETFVGGKEKNKHVSKRKPRVLGDSPKMVVIGVASRTGKLAMKYITKLNIAHIKPVLNRNIDFDNATLHTDESPLYKRYNRQVVCHSRGEYARGSATTNRIEGVFSHFKRMVFGVFHQISDRHINLYIGGFCFRYNHRDISATDKFNLAMGLMFGKKLMYCQLIK